MNVFKTAVSGVVALAFLFQPGSTFAANHREAPITAIDRAADIADFFAFVSYDDPSKATLILNVDPLLEPANGPNYFPFDPEITYRINVDNNHDAVEDLAFEFKFETEQRLPGVFTGLVGAGAGIAAPANSPAPVPPGTPIVPPAITTLDGAGSEGLGFRQKYSVTKIAYKKEGKKDKQTLLGSGLIAVPSNVGPRTMPDYAALAAQGIYDLGDGVRVFAGTVDDPFYIDLGAAFDSLNLRTDPAAFPSGVSGVLTDLQDGDDATNFSSDDVSGFNVNTIAVEVPITMLTSDGETHLATEPEATIGTYGSTLRPRKTVLQDPEDDAGPKKPSDKLRQVQRMGNPLINELIIGTGSKDKFSMSPPANDADFAAFALDPLLARVLNAIYGIDIPAPPRLDLLPLVTYAPPIAAAGTPAGPVADLLRLNTGVGPTSLALRRRLGLLVGDGAGFPNGRRVSDDVTDISLRAVAGVLAGGATGGFPHNRLGDAVNANDVSYQETFPYVAFAQSGRNSRHIDPGEPGGGPVD